MSNLWDFLTVISNGNPVGMATFLAVAMFPAAMIARLWWGVRQNEKRTGRPFI